MDPVSGITSLSEKWYVYEKLAPGRDSRKFNWLRDKEYTQTHIIHPSTSLRSIAHRFALTSVDRCQYDSADTRWLIKFSMFLASKGRNTVAGIKRERFNRNESKGIRMGWNAHDDEPCHNWSTFGAVSHARWLSRFWHDFTVFTHTHTHTSNGPRIR